MSELTEYYTAQAGHGISVYKGHRFRGVQKGDGFLGRFFTSTLIPLLGRLGSYAFNKGKELFTPFVRDLHESDDFKTLLKKTGRRAAKQVLSDIADKVGPQDGSGMKKRKCTILMPRMITIKGRGVNKPKKRGRKRSKKSVINKRRGKKKLVLFK